MPTVVQTYSLKEALTFVPGEILAANLTRRDSPTGNGNVTLPLPGQCDEYETRRDGIRNFLLRCTETLYLFHGTIWFTCGSWITRTEDALLWSVFSPYPYPKALYRSGDTCNG